MEVQGMVAAKPGSRWASTTCSTEVVIVKCEAADLDLECGGAKMVPVGDPSAATGTPTPGADSGTQMGKRYVDPDETLELLCTKPGDGSLAVGGQPLEIKGAKPLPSSD
jgi:hypothetical protein